MEDDRAPEQAPAEVVSGELVPAGDAPRAVVEAAPAGAFMSSGEIEQAWRTASALHKSNYFRDTRSAEQAFAKILFGRDLGLTPTAAMMGIHIIEGRPEISANLQAQAVRIFRGAAGERYDYRLLTPRELREQECEIAFFRIVDGEREELGVERYSMDDARRAGLAGKQNYLKHPRNMLFARCLSNGVAFHCPEVMNGYRVYSEGEIEQDRTAVSETQGPPELVDERAEELKQQARDLYDEIKEMTPGGVGVQFPPGAFNARLRAAWHSHEALEQFVGLVRSKLEEARGAREDGA